MNGVPILVNHKILEEFSTFATVHCIDQGSVIGLNGMVKPIPSGQLLNSSLGIIIYFPSNFGKGAKPALI